MLVRRRPDILPSEITSKGIYENRRKFIQAAGILAAAGLGASAFMRVRPARAATKLSVRPSPLSVSETPTSFKDVTTYNNYYEFGTDKTDPSETSDTLKTRPWTVAVEGEIKKPKVYDIDELLKLAPLEERVYRMRCVEGWSMVIPWDGFSLSELIKRAEPTSKAKFVEFITLADPAQMPGIGMAILKWPYLEALRMDEAMHPLTLLGLGLYGEVLPNQNGAPIRLVVPWKYGFYANVNPQVDHPRWSQGSERRLGEFFRRKTLMFNGYADQVQGLYAGLDLKKNY